MDTKGLDTLAYAVSVLFHPVLVVLVLGSFFLYSRGLTAFEVSKWVSITVFVGIVPLLSLMYLKEGEINVVERADRNFYYRIGVGLLIFQFLVAWLLDAPVILKNAFLLATAIILILGAVNRFTKISIHVGVISGFAGFFLLESAPVAVLLASVAVIVSWSRVRLGRHTYRQVILGFSIPFILVSTVYLQVF